MDVQVGERLQQPTERLDQRVDFRETGRGLGADEGGAPAVGVDQVDEIVLGLRFHTRPEHAAGGVRSLPTDVMESRASAFGFEHVGGGERVGVANRAVFLLGDLRGGDAKAKEAGVHRVESFFDGRVIQKILVDVGAQLGTGVHKRAAGDGADLVDDRRGKAGVEYSRTGGTCSTEEKNFHEEGVYTNRTTEVRSVHGQMGISGSEIPLDRD